MLRFLRIYLLGCIAISLGFLVLHAREPLRLNVGDPLCESTRGSDEPCRIDLAIERRYPR